MSLKTILCVFGGTPGEHKALDMAFRLARASASALRVVHLTPAPALLAGLGGGLPDPTPVLDADVLTPADRDAIDRARRQVADCALRFGRRLHPEAGDRASPADVEFRSLIGTAGDCLPHQGRTVDLIVAGDDRDLRVLPPLLSGTGRAVLMVPDTPWESAWNDAAPRLSAIAWDGSLSAARALQAAFSLMAPGVTAHLLSVEEGRSRPGEGSEEDVLAYVRSHAIDIDSLHLPREARSVGEALLTQAKRLGAGLLVMGAFRGGVVTERVLGGTTLYIARHATMPLLLAH